MTKHKGRLFGKPHEDDLFITCYVCADCYELNPETTTFSPSYKFFCIHFYLHLFHDVPYRRKFIGGYRAYPYSLRDFDKTIS